MDDLTKRILANQKEVDKARKRGFPRVSFQCRECGKVEERDTAASLDDWLKWEENGKPVLAGWCLRCQAAEPGEDDEQ